MRRSVVGGVCGPIGALIIAASALTDGCALFDDEGEYEAPVGFTTQQASRMALSPGAFVRDGARVLNGSAASRKARAGGEEDEPGARPRLESEFFGTYAEGMRVNASSNPRAYVDVVPEGAAAVPGRVRHDGAVLAFENAFPGVTSAFGADDHKVEEFLTIPSIEAVPALAYALRDGPEFGSWVEEEGKLWAFDKAGRGLFTLEPPIVEDATGKTVTGSWNYTKIEGGVRITPALDWASLEFPLIFDPTFETPLWFFATNPVEPLARAGAGSAFYPLGRDCAVIFGGMGANAVARNDVNVRCAGVWQRGGTGVGIPASAVKPTERAYSAMAYVPATKVPTAGIYMYSGYTSTGLTDDFWRLNLAGTAAATTAVWTRITPPVPQTSTNWPLRRYLAGMAYTNAGLILFGGVNVQGVPLRDTWLYDGTSWSKVCDNCIAGRYGAAYAQLGTEASPEVVVFGGYDTVSGALTNTVQRFTGAGWETVNVESLAAPTNNNGAVFTGDVAPPPRYVAWASRTADDNLMVGSGLNFGACGGAAEFTDAWVWNRSGGQNRWQLVNTAPSLVQPGKRESGNAIFNTATNEILFFGGRTNCGSTASTALITGGRTYRGNSGQANLSVRCIDTGAPGGPNGNTCERYMLTATVSGIANDTSPSRMRAFFSRRRGAVWQNAGTAALCGTGNAPIAPNAGPTTFQCEVTGFTTGAIDTGFSVRLRDLGYVAASSGLCGGTNLPVCTTGFAASATCAGDPFPVGNNATTACTRY